MRLLKEYGLNFVEAFSINEIIDANVIFTDDVHLINHSHSLKNKIVIVNEFISQNLIFKISPYLYDKDVFNEVTVGIDPGKTYGFIILVDGKIFLKKEFRELDPLIELLFKAINNIPSKNVSVRIGNGGGQFLKFLIHKLRNAVCNHCNNVQKNVQFEIVDENSLFSTFSEHEDQFPSDNVLSAYRIALSKGRRIEINEFAH